MKLTTVRMWAVTILLSIAVGAIVPAYAQPITATASVEKGTGGDPIPSQLSGIYVGTGDLSGWSCTMLAQRYGTASYPGSGAVGLPGIEAACTSPESDPLQRRGLAYTYGPCPGSTTQPLLAPWGKVFDPATVERFSVLSWGPPPFPSTYFATLNVQIGSPATGYRTGFMYGIQRVNVPRPYPGCEPTRIGKDR